MNTEEILLNLLYQQWILNHNPFEDDFVNYVYNEIKRSVVQITEFEWIFIA